MARNLSFHLVIAIVLLAITGLAIGSGPSFFEIATRDASVTREENSREPSRVIVKKSIRPMMEISATLAAKATVYQKSDSLKSERALVSLELEPVVTFTFSDSLSAKVGLSVRSDSESFRTGIRSRLAGNITPAVDVTEAWVEYAKGPVSVKVGKQIFEDWSVTDTVSPAGVINPKDWTESLIDHEDVGVPAVSFRYDQPNWFAQAIFVPIFTPSRLPKGRWEEDLPLGITKVEEDWDENQPQFAFRIGGDHNGYEWQLMFYDGVSYNPYGRVDGTTLNLNYSEQKVYAGSLTKELPWGLIGKAEFGYYDQEFGDDFVQGVVGLRRETDGLFKANDRLSVLVQYADELVTSKDKSVVPVTDFRRDLSQKTFSGRVSYQPKADGEWEFEVEGTYSLDGRDYLIKPSISYFEEDWEWELGYQKTGGPRKSFWGKYGDEVDAVTFEIKHSF